jgi:hypothetical protein
VPGVGAKHALRPVMRTKLAILIGVLGWMRSQAGAVELHSEATVSREFVYVASDVGAEVLDGRLGVGGGLIMVSDFVNERYGAQGSIEYRGEHVSAGVDASYGPRQAARGWATIDPHGELQLSVGDWRLRAELGVLLRRIDAQARRRAIEVDQLQLHANFEACLGDRWTVGLVALWSFYSPDPAVRSMRGLDLGLAVTIAGRPERWALGGRVGARVVRALRAEFGVTGVVYADGVGSAFVPRILLRAGTWRGFSIATSLDVVVGVGEAALEPTREIAGVEIGYER